MEDIQLAFFDIEAPCPDSIPNCEFLRSEYIKERDSLLTQGVCIDCVMRGLRNKYTTFILATTNC